MMLRRVFFALALAAVGADPVQMTAYMSSL